MKREVRSALVVTLAEDLDEAGSWCGETHLQKAVYFLQTVFKVPTGFEFILYKHGPFSFDLRDEITAMVADGLLEVQRQTPPYGPRLIPTENGFKFRNSQRTGFKPYEVYFRFVAETFSDQPVSYLEQLSTALLVSVESGEGAALKTRVKELHELKPHISKTDSKSALKEIDRILEHAREVTGKA